MDHERRIWDLMEQTGVGILTTRFAGGMRARPLYGEKRKVEVEP